MGPVASAMLVAKAVLNLKPQLVVIVGICAGIQGKADIGDVIAADISWDWQSGKYFDKNGKEHFEISPHQIAIDEKTRSQLMLLKRDNDFWASLGTISAKYSRKPPKLVIGPIATGSSVLADARVSDRIKSTQHRNLAGLDMEVYGAYAAALYCDPNVRFLALKAVCDKGDRQKDDSFQQYASEVAAQTAVHFLRSYAEPLLS
jgi:nucleoside phosphorylase